VIKEHYLELRTSDSPTQTVHGTVSMQAIDLVYQDGARQGGTRGTSEDITPNIRAIG
jgi:hypothetical protein